MSRFLSKFIKPAIFFDRDGVINIDTNYPYRLEDLILVEGVEEAICQAKKLGFLTVVVTNQSGVARGFFTERDVQNFHRYIQEKLKKYNTAIDAFYYCPYHPEAKIKKYRQDHPDRKPHPGMIEHAIHDLFIDRQHSFLIGDKSTDLQAAENANITGYLFKEKNLASFLNKIIKKQLKY